MTRLGVGKAGLMSELASASAASENIVPSEKQPDFSLQIKQAVNQFFFSITTNSWLQSRERKQKWRSKSYQSRARGLPMCWRMCGKRLREVRHISSLFLSWEGCS
jgi:hypothetical protein